LRELRGEAYVDIRSGAAASENATAPAPAAKDANSGG